MGSGKLFSLGLAVASLPLALACQRPGSESSEDLRQYIYVSSGTVYAGPGITPTTPSKTIAKYDMDGNFVSLVKDYSYSAADTPVSLLDYDSNRLLVLIENTSGRRVDMVYKDGSGSYTVFSNNTNLNKVLRGFMLNENNQFIISKSSAIERIQFSGTQVPGPSGGSFISNPAAPCATANSLITGIARVPQGHWLLSHAGASPNNKIIAIKKTGYGAAADCLAATSAAPSNNHLPTGLLLHSSGVLFVSFSSNTGAVHQIYAFTPTFTESTVDFGDWPQAPALNDLSLVQGISRMTEMPDGSLLVAAAHPTLNLIEKFRYNEATGELEREGSSPFIGPSIFTRSVSGILITD